MQFNNGNMEVEMSRFQLLGQKSAFDLLVGLFLLPDLLLHTISQPVKWFNVGLLHVISRAHWADVNRKRGN